MPLSVNWYDDSHSIILVTLTRDSTWEQYHQAISWIVSEAAKESHRVDIIFHDNVGMPKGNPMPHLSRGSARIIEQTNIHFSIICGTQGYAGFVRIILLALAKAFSRFATSTGSNRLLFLRDLNEALAHIQKDRHQSSTA